MFCPECRSEYREGFVECADCEVPLVEGLPAEGPVPDLNLVTVLDSSDPSVLAVAESLLLEAQIPYLKRGDQIQDLFAWGRLFTGFNPAVGPVLVQVPEEHAEAALELLAELNSAGEEDDPDRLEEPE
jgi:hypothetical protein